MTIRPSPARAAPMRSTTKGRFPKKPCSSKKGRHSRPAPGQAVRPFDEPAPDGPRPPPGLYRRAIPRMANTYIDRGEYDPEEILRSVKKGFYAERFTGGQVEDSASSPFP